MKKLYLLIILLLVIAFVIANGISSNNGEMSVSEHKEWKVVSRTGQEAQLTFWTAEAKDKKTELGWIPPNNDCSGWDDKYLYDENNQIILDDKDKEIKLKCESSKCNGSNCYYISLTDEQAVNIDEYIKLGENSIVTEYQNISTIQYIYENTLINTTLERCENGTCGIAYPEVLIVNSSNLKFGAEDTNVTTDTWYRYTFKSSHPIESTLGEYYVNTGIKKKRGFVGFGGAYFKAVEINTTDICYTLYNESNSSIIDFQSNCSFTTYSNTTITIINESENYTTTFYYLEIDFIGDYNETAGTMFIDPSYTIDDFDDSTEIITNNVTIEANFSHLEINDSGIYEYLVAYWNFDGDIEDTFYFTARDWAGSNDGTAVGNTTVNTSQSCIYGNCAEFDGTGDYLDVGDSEELDGYSAMSWSFWMYANELNSNMDIINKWTASGGLRSYSLSVNNEGGSMDTYLYVSSDGDGTESESSETDIDANQWVHIVAVFDSGNFTVYKNGVSKGSNANFSTHTSIFAGGDNLKIGTGISGTDFNGSIDEVVIFNTSLSDAQILEIYNNQSSRFKHEGKQIHENFFITKGNDMINLSTSVKADLDSNLSVRLGRWDASLDSALIGYWNLDNRSAEGENDSLVKDYAGNNNGTFTVSADADSGATSDGYYDGAFMFDGDGDCIGFGDMDNMTEDLTGLTVSAWIKIADLDTQSGYIVTKWMNSGAQESWKLDWATTFNRIVFSVENASSTQASAVSTDNTINDNNWHHVVGVYNGTGPSVYVDGSQVSYSILTLMTGKITNTAAWVSIGDRATTTACGDGYVEFNGTIDEVAIWNRSLSAEEITDLYEKGKVNWNYTEYKNYTDGVNFNISTDTVYILPEFTFLAGNQTNPFYSPILSGQQTYTTYDAPSGVTDDEYPFFTNYTSNNGTVNGSGTAVFNVSVSLTNGTVILEINNTNYTASNYSDTEFNASVEFTKGGDYSYQWASWGNGTSGNYNTSTVQYYTVNVTQQDYFRNIFQGVTSSLSPGSLGNFFRNIPTDILQSQFVASLTSFFREIPEYLSLTSNIDRLGNFFRTTSQSLSISSISDYLRNIPRNIPYVLSITSTADRFGSFFRNPTGESILTLFTSRTSQFTRQVSQQLSITPFVIKIRDFFTDAPSILSLSSIVSRLKESYRTAPQTLSIVPTIQRTGNFFRNVFQSIIATLKRFVEEITRRTSNERGLSARQEGIIQEIVEEPEQVEEEAFEKVIKVIVAILSLLIILILILVFIVAIMSDRFRSYVKHSLVH